MCCTGTLHIPAFAGRRVSSLTPDEIKRLQALIGMKGSLIDGRDTPLFRQRLESYEKARGLGHYHKHGVGAHVHR